MITLPLVLRSPRRRQIHPRGGMLAAIGFTRGVKLLAVLGLGAVLVGFASLCVFTVGGGEFAVVTQFGDPVRVESAPGLHLCLERPRGIRAP